MMRAWAPTSCLIVMLLGTSPAAANPTVTPDGGDGVATGIQTPGASGNPGVGSGGGASNVGAGSSGGGGSAPCSYTALTPAEALAAGLLSPDNGGVDNVQRTDGSFVRRDCTASGGGQTVLWVPAGDGAGAPAGVPVVTPAMLAQEARNLLQLPTPAIGVNPDGANQNPALVRLPTWWWVTNGEPLTQRTAVGSVWAEVTAEAVSSTWVAGDGTRSECPGLGMAWARGMDEYERGSCSHTYTRSNASEVAGVEVVWQVSWVGSGGTGGTLEPFTLSATQAVPVYERQAIVTSAD